MSFPQKISKDIDTLKQKQLSLSQIRYSVVGLFTILVRALLKLSSLFKLRNFENPKKIRQRNVHVGYIIHIRDASS